MANRSNPAGGPDKFQRYRASKKAAGMKLVRLWMPDPRTPGFAAEAERQARLLRGAQEEVDALDFIEAAAEGSDAAR